MSVDKIRLAGGKAYKEVLCKPGKYHTDSAVLKPFKRDGFLRFG